MRRSKENLVLQGVVVQCLNILVIVLMPLKLLMKTPALVKICIKIQKDGQQVKLCEFSTIA